MRVLRQQCFVFFSVAIFLFFHLSCAGLSKSQSNQKVEPVKNVILFIGDGMGPSVVSAARVEHLGKNKKLSLDSFKNLAKIKTYSEDSPVTDSAASATAMATGYKTKNKALSVSVINKKVIKKYETILEIAAKKNKYVGLVTTSHILHATPAAFFSHVPHRDMYNEIALDLYKSPVDLILGGGKKFVDPYKNKLEEKFKLVENSKNINLCQKNRIVGVFSEEHLPFNDQMDLKTKKKISLKNLTAKALKCAANKKEGFFLMVEGARIDHALHLRKHKTALSEMIAFDQTVKMTMVYLKKNNLLKNTLVLVTADHDTGGLAVNGPISDSSSFFDKKGHIKKTQKKKGLGPLFPILKLSSDPLHGSNPVDSTHTGVDVTLYAEGQGSEKIKGTFENTQIFQIIKKAFNF